MERSNRTDTVCSYKSTDTPLEDSFGILPKVLSKIDKSLK